jgi:mannose-6-phosphate isomerase-like protein (cupin superfamily)
MFHRNIKEATKENNYFRQVVYTGDNAQLVLMSIPMGSDIGEETHPNTDQLLFLVDGEGEAIVAEQTTPFKKNEVVFVPAGTKHNFKNTGDDDLKIFTVYSPPMHAPNTIHKTKEDALAEEKLDKSKSSAGDFLENM